MSDETETTTADVQAAINAGLALAVPHEIDHDAGVFSITVPADGRQALIDLEQYAHAPRRLKGTYRPATVDALSSLVSRHADQTATTLWVNPTSGRIVAVFNDNDGQNVQPGWRDHRAELALQHTPEWLHWTQLDGQLVGQVQFAEHIEDGLDEIREPAAADMLEIAQTISAVRTANFRSAQRLSDGNVQMRYEEETDAKAGASGEFGVPTEFTLGISPFVGEQPIEVGARFRYRLASGRLTMGYKLDRPDHKVRFALDEIADRLRGSHPGMDVLIGDPA